MGKNLSPESYAPVETRQLTKARILWVNYDLLRSMNIEVPAEGMTPAFERALLDALGYAVPQKNDDPSLFGEKTKTFSADLYGGLGMNGNLGSGRAASSGEVQIKGIGRTSLVGKKVTDFGHSHGGASITESIQEAVWGEILHRELPNGASRIVALLSTGTETDHGDWKEARALAVRVDPLRPAAFLTNQDADGDEAVRDQARVHAALKKISLAYPAKKQNLPTTETLQDGLHNYLEKLGRQYGTAYAKRFFHGATSPSNMMTNGGSLDFGTQTALPDWQRFKILADESWFGDPTTQETDLIDQIMFDLTKSLPNDLRAAVPNAEESRKIFRAAYHGTVNNEFLKLTGAPEKLLRQVPPNQDLAELLETIATAGHEEIHQHQGSRPKKIARHDLPRILMDLARVNSDDIADYEIAITKSLPDPILRHRLAKLYTLFRAQVAEAGEKDGLTRNNLARFFEQASVVRNRPLPELYIGHERWERINKVVSAVSDGSKGPQEIQKYIDASVAQNTRDHRDVGDFEVTVLQHERPDQNLRYRRVFDAKSGEFRDEIRRSESSVLPPLEVEGRMATVLVSKAGDFSTFTTVVPRRGSRLSVAGKPGCPWETLLEKK